jgi:hypothetical protein
MTSNNVPTWAVATPINRSTKSRQAGGLVLQPWQSAWRPYHLSINPQMIEPEHYSANSYTYYNMAHNSQYQPFPKLVSSSGRFATTPVNLTQAFAK